MVIVILPQRQPDLLGTLDSLGSSRNFNPNPNPISYGLHTNLISKTVDGWLLFYLYPQKKGLYTKSDS